jgi:uncharacterized short protein YbdD (DUF466 family)
MGILSYGYKGAVAGGKKVFQKVFGKKSKVSPDIKSVKPNLTKTVKQTKSDVYVKRIRELDSAEKKIKSGKEMMKEGQKARKKMADTGRAFQFKSSKSYHPMKPGDKDKYKANMKVAGPQKKFKTGKELEREKKMGGGMMGRRMGYSQGSNGKPISRSKNPGLLAMSKTEKGKEAIKKMKFNPNRIVAKKGGRS